MICGRLSQGPICETKRCAKAEYKLARRNKQTAEDKHISNDLHYYPLSKDTTACLLETMGAQVQK
jgi:hypothetical protein